MMIKGLVIKEYFGNYYFLFFLSFLSIYFFSFATPFVNVVILGTSYYLIIRKQRLDVVIALILYSRCLNGFVIYHNQTIFQIINLMTNAIPVLLYFIITLSHDGAVLKKSVFVKYKFTLLFFALLTFSFLWNFSSSYDLITKRFLPMAFFVVFLILFSRPRDFDTEGVTRFFRTVLAASLIAYFFCDYLSITTEIMESDKAFSRSSDPRTFSFTYFTFNRNMGPTWDHRIFAIFCYLLLLLSIVNKSKYLKWDIILSSLVILTTLSRGGILTYSLILLAYFFVVQRRLIIVSIAFFIVVLLVFLFFSSVLLPEAVLDFLSSFNPTVSGNALEQRGGFAAYAMSEFIDNPIFGSGVGHLSSSLADHSIVLGNAIYNTATDAFWFILLAEMGIIGFLLYILFLKEVFLSKSVLMIALFIGFSIQLLGTDIPDMRFYYFGFLVIMHMTKKSLNVDMANSKNLK